MTAVTKDQYGRDDWQWWVFRAWMGVILAITALLAGVFVLAHLSPAIKLFWLGSDLIAGAIFIIGSYVVYKVDWEDF